MIGIHADPDPQNWIKEEQTTKSFQNHLLSKLHMIATTIPLGSFLSSWTECGAEKLRLLISE